MPAVPHGPSTSAAPMVRPANPNDTHDGAAHTASASITHQPAPAVVASSSHVDTHVLPRRFLGPMPEAVANSDEVLERRRRLRALRTAAIHRLRGNVDEGGAENAEHDHGRVARAVRRIKVPRRGRHGEELEEHVDLDLNLEDEDDSDTNSGFRHKRKKRKDVWVGESFDIGREFFSSIVAVEGTNTPRRPPNQPRSTQETFVTAKTHFASSSRSTLSAHPPSTRTLSGPAEPRASQTSSMQPLLPGLSDDESENDQIAHDDHTVKTAPAFKTRLHSALRRRSGTSRSGTGAPKSVQFPLDPVQHSPTPDLDSDPPLKGNQRPADPGDVLAREGDDAAGTSHQAVAEALEDQEEWEEDEPGVGGILMRDRMLVRVAYHREESIATFDEAFQRRKPCVRMDPMEEYIVIWRKGRIELYSDWRMPLRERWAGKRLCFVIPLAPTRTSLSIFNLTDMTLSLTTVASRLGEDVERLLRSNSTRYGAMKDRVKHSRQASWLKRARKGSHVFILKVAERSRALDWYWELWRELGGELPTRLDIVVPSLSTSVRLLIPEEDERTRHDLSPATLIQTCWEMIGEAVDLGSLLANRSERAEELDLELAWKGVDGSLDWLAHGTTVQGRPRDWSVLAGVARASHEGIQALQLRPARHQPRALRLEDGTFLDEPPGIEGYLVRHKSAAAAASKQDIYAATHDGNIFIAEKSHASPPVKPAKQGSTPMDIFHDVFMVFQSSEHRRMASFVERCAGCFDLRSVTQVRLCGSASPAAPSAGAEAPQNDGSDPAEPSRRERCFDVSLPSGNIRLEANSPEVAKEWVERLEALIAYWKLRHRVDARIRMDAIALNSRADPFAGTELGEQSDQILADIWDWCALKGCRSLTMAGRLYFKQGKYNKFKSRYMVLTGGCLVAFKVGSDPFLPRKNKYPLFGAYAYSGMLAQDELHESVNEGGFSNTARVYQDGLQSSDGAEDTTFCVRLPVRTSVWGKRRTQPWEQEPDVEFLPPGLSTSPPALLIFRARSKLERDRWVWGINAEMERQVRAHVKQEEALRQVGRVPDTA